MLLDVRLYVAITSFANHGNLGYISEWMIRATRFFCCFLIACLFAEGISSALKYALEAPEIRNYQPGKPFFTKPRSEAYARLVAQQFREKQERDGVLERFAANHSWPVGAAAKVVGFALDPINDLILAICLAFTWYFSMILFPARKQQLPAERPSATPR